MIKNERQYQVTTAQADRFARAIADTEARTDGDPALRQLELDALRSQFSDLKQEISEYEKLRSGHARSSA